MPTIKKYFKCIFFFSIPILVIKFLLHSEENILRNHIETVGWKEMDIRTNYLVNFTTNQSHAVIIEKMEKEEEYPNKLKNHQVIFSTKSTPQERVFIWTLTRSGSSFLGHLFEKHERVWYMFEPFQKVKWLTENGSSDLRTSFLIDLLNCDISAQHEQDFRKLRRSDTGNYDSTTKARCSIQPFKCNNRSNLRFPKQRDKFDIMKEERRAKVFRSLCLECGGKDDRTLFHEDCHKKSHIVLKEILIRIYGGLERYHEMSKSFWKTKIIHLIRDPRAVIASQIKAEIINKTHVNFSKTIQSQCNQSLNDYNFGTKMLQPYGLYTLIRYEDLCMNFKKEFQRLLRYVNLPRDRKYEIVLEWMESLQEVPAVIRQITYSVFREMKHQVTAWRKKISMNLVHIVEKECSLFMEKFRYKKVDGNFGYLLDKKYKLY